MTDLATIACPVQEKAFDELVALAAERQEKTCELFTPNDFYGHATILKRYAGLPCDIPLQGVIPHGPSINHSIWNPELKAPVDHIYAISEEQRDCYEKATTKEVSVIGSPVHYVERMIAEEIQAIRRRANGTVAFPAHSTHHLTSNFDQDAFIKELFKLQDDMGPVRVCLYWRDVQLGRHKPYSEAGFECLTAGHMFDDKFQYRMLRIFASHQNAITNKMGSSSLLAASLGLTVHLIEQETHVRGENDQFIKEAVPVVDQPSAVRLLETMRIAPGKPRPAQKTFGDIATGRNRIMDPEKLKVMLLDHIHQPRRTFWRATQHRTWDEEIERLRNVVEDSNQSLPRHLVITPQGIPFRTCKPDKFLEEYDIWQMENVFPDLSRIARPVILDCGSDTGYSAIRLAESFPDASVLCIEANPDKVKLIQQNINARGVQSVDVVQKAVWIESAAVAFEIESKEGDKETIQVEAFRLKDLLKGESFDLVRLNVSNAILPVIRDCAESLRKVKHWILHFPCPAADRNHLVLLLAELSAFGFHLQIKRITSHTSDESELELLITAQCMESFS